MFKFTLTAFILVDSLTNGLRAEYKVSDILSSNTSTVPCTIFSSYLVAAVFSPTSHGEVQQAVDNCYGPGKKSPSAAQSMYHDPKAGILAFYGHQKEYGFLSNFYPTVRSWATRATQSSTYLLLYI